TPFFTMRAKRWPRVPMPNFVPSSSSPKALTYVPLPSASIRILSPTPPCLPHAFITNTSFTAVHAMVSTPLALIWSASSTKPGKCLASQVGVNAPGTEKNTTVLPANNCSVVIFCGPSEVMRVNAPSGILSPALMVIEFSPAIRLSTHDIAVQLVQLGDARALVGNGFQTGEGLLGVREVLELDLRPAQIHVGLVRMLDLALLQAS